MPTTLTDVDSFDAPALVPVDGDSATASSVTAEFQVLQNRTLYAKNRAASAKAEIDGLYTQLVSGLAIVGIGQVSHSGGIGDSQTAVTLKLVSNGSFTVPVIAGDYLQFTIGPISAEMSGGTTGILTYTITEDYGVSSTPTVSDGTATTEGTRYDLSYNAVYHVTKTGTLSVALGIQGDGTHAFSVSTQTLSRWATWKLMRSII